MIVYLNSNGTIEQVVPQSLTQGSNNENLIVVGENLSSFTALSAVFKLPNKQVLAPILMTKQQSNYVINNEIVNVWTCSLTEAVTNFSGTLELTINANAGGVITNSYTGAVQIAPTNAPSFPTIDQSAVEVFNQIAEAYGDITGKLDNKQDKLDESLDTVDKTVVGAINEINTKETQNAGDIAEIMSDISNIQGDINDIENGTTVVAKASADQNGDNIVNTYQKKADNGLDTVNKTVVGGINELKDQAVLNAENIQNANQEITDIKDDYATKVYVDNAIMGVTIGVDKTLVFDTEQDFLDWLDGTYQRADGKMPSALNIGDAILIKEQDVPDWWVSSKSKPMTINDFSEYEVKIETPETKIDDDSITENSNQELQAVKLKNAFTNVDTTVTKSDFSGATKLSKEQYYELLQYGQIEVDGQVITFSEGEFYITPDLSEDFDDRITTLETTVTELTPEVAKSLKTPMTAPISTELVAVDTSNGQAMIAIGDGLVIENDTLKATGGGGDTTELEEKVNQMYNTQIKERYLSSSKIMKNSDGTVRFGTPLISNSTESLFESDTYSMIAVTASATTEKLVNDFINPTITRLNEVIETVDGMSGGGGGAVSGTLKSEQFTGTTITAFRDFLNSKNVYSITLGTGFTPITVNYINTIIRADGTISTETSNYSIVEGTKFYRSGENTFTRSTGYQQEVYNASSDYIYPSGIQIIAGNIFIPSLDANNISGLFQEGEPYIFEYFE